MHCNGPLMDCANFASVCVHWWFVCREIIKGNYKMSLGERPCFSARHVASPLLL